MKPQFAPFLLLLFFGLGLNSQSSEDLSAFYNVDIDYFFADEKKETDLFKALKFYIDGDLNSANLYFKNHLVSYPKDEDVKALLLRSMKYSEDQYKIAKQAKDLSSFSNFYLKFGKPFVEMEENKVSIPLDQNIIYGSINGQDSIRIFFNTGAGGIVINPDLVDELGLQKNDDFPTEMSSMAYWDSIPNPLFPTIIPNLDLGGIVLSNLPAQYNERSSEEEDFDLCIGLDVFQKLLDRITFDYKRKKLIFEKEIDDLYSQPNFLFIDNKPVMKLNSGRFKFKGLVDTGSSKDQAPHQFYSRNYNSKENKKLEEYSYREYACEIQFNEFEEKLNMRFSDFGRDYSLFLESNKTKVDFLIGNKRQKIVFDLKNRLIVVK